MTDADETVHDPATPRGANPLVLGAGYLLPGDFLIIDSIGVGGFGITYLAQHRLLGQKRVAIKEYLPRDYAYRDSSSTIWPNSESVKRTYEWGLSRFKEEAARVFSLSNPAERHPNIVVVETMFESNNTAYIVMELVEGRMLSQAIDEKEVFDEARIRRIARALLDALEQVHDRGILHRDITPTNIILRPDDQPVIIDFGSARTDIQGPSKYTRLFTPGYASLEQARAAEGDTEDARTDIYGLAATLYHLVFHECPPDSLTRATSSPDPLTPASERGAGKYDAAFLASLDKALAIHREDRLASVAEWRALLGEWADEPRTSLAISPAPRPRARGRSLVLAAVLGAALAVPVTRHFAVDRSVSTEVLIGKARGTLEEAIRTDAPLIESKKLFLRAMLAPGEEDAASVAGVEAIQALDEMRVAMVANDLRTADTRLRAALEYLRAAQIDAEIGALVQRRFDAWSNLSSAHGLLAGSDLEDETLEAAANALAAARELGAEEARVAGGEQALESLRAAQGQLAGADLPGALDSAAAAAGALSTMAFGDAGKTSVVKLVEGEVRRALGQTLTATVAELVARPLEDATLDRADRAYASAGETYERLAAADGVNAGRSGKALVAALRAIAAEPTGQRFVLPRPAEYRANAMQAGFSDDDVAELESAMHAVKFDQALADFDPALAERPLDANEQARMRSLVDGAATARITPAQRGALAERGALLVGLEEIRKLAYEEADTGRARRVLAATDQAPGPPELWANAGVMLDEVDSASLASLLADAGRALPRDAFPGELSQARSLYQRAAKQFPDNATARQGQTLTTELEGLWNDARAGRHLAAWEALERVSANTFELEGARDAVGSAEGWLRGETTKTLIQRIKDLLQELRAEGDLSEWILRARAAAGEIGALEARAGIADGVVRTESMRRAAEAVATLLAAIAQRPVDLEAADGASAAAGEALRQSGLEEPPIGLVPARIDLERQRVRQELSERPLEPRRLEAAAESARRVEALEGEDRRVSDEIHAFLEVLGSAATRRGEGERGRERALASLDDAVESSRARFSRIPSAEAILNEAHLMVASTFPGAELIAALERRPLQALELESLELALADFPERATPPLAAVRKSVRKLQAAQAATQETRYQTALGELDELTVDIDAMRSAEPKLADAVSRAKERLAENLNLLTLKPRVYLRTFARVTKEVREDLLAKSSLIRAELLVREELLAKQADHPASLDVLAAIGNLRKASGAKQACDVDAAYGLLDDANRLTRNHFLDWSQEVETAKQRIADECGGPDVG